MVHHRNLGLIPVLVGRASVGTAPTNYKTILSSLTYGKEYFLPKRRATNVGSPPTFVALFNDRIDVLHI